MATIHRIRTAITGMVGAPGVMTMYAADAPALAPLLRTYLFNQSDKYPAACNWTVENTGDILDSVTGLINGLWTTSVQDPVGGSGGTFAGPAGFSVRWDTSIFLSGRRLRGRNYFVPAASAIFDVDGTINSTVLLALRGNAAAFVASAVNNLGVWQRPRDARPANGTVPPVTARSGGWGLVTGSSVADKAAVLRSRRD